MRFETEIGMIAGNGQDLGKSDRARGDPRLAEFAGSRLDDLCQLTKTPPEDPGYSIGQKILRPQQKEIHLVE